eukprot:scaffold398_cov177-Ochromonas_danica.AAC.9
MAFVNVININILDNPTAFTNPFQFEVTFECLQELPEEDSHRDQVLEEVNVGPIPAGLHRFVLQTPAPRSDLIKNDDLIGVTVILITCSYLDQPFVQIGYYVNNEYEEPFEPENYPNPVDIKKLKRNILADQPRVTRYMIDWMAKPVQTAQTNTSFSTDEVGNNEPEPEDDVVEMTEEMEEAEDSEEDDDEDGDVNEEIDLEAEEEEEEEEETQGEEGGHGEGETGTEFDGSLEGSVHYEGMEILEDSNSIDIGRMIEKYRS